MLRVTELQARMLEALQRYTYLTASQFQRLGISSSLPVIWRELRHLSTGKRAVIKRIDFPPQLRVERVERMHYLSRYGAAVLAELQHVDVAEINAPRSVRVFHRDYWHRRCCIDFHIWLTQALAARPWDIEITAWDRYFDKIGANRTKNAARRRLRAKTRLDLAPNGYIIPDVNFVLRSRRSPEKAALFCLEMCIAPNTKRVLQQIQRHTVAMQQGAMAQQYGTRQTHRALFLFAEKGFQNAVLDRLSEIDRTAYLHLLYFGHLEEAAGDPLGCWQQPGQAGTFNFVTGKPVSPR